MAGNIWGGNVMQQQGAANTAQSAGNSMVVFINDDSVAMNYPIAPGYTVALINANDPNEGKLFIRSSESNGMPKATRTFAIQEITPQQQSDGVPRKDFEVLSQQVATLGSQFQQLLAAMQQQAASTTAPAASTKGGKKQ